MPPLLLTPHSADLPAAQLSGFVGLFAPEADTPDHVMTWLEQETGPLRWIAKTVRRHDAWVRTDISDGTANTIEHVHVPTGVTVTFAENTDGPVQHFGIRAPERGRAISGTEFPGSATGDEGHFAGEPCRWWNVYGGTSDGQPTYSHQACVTPDGITIASHTLGRDRKVWSFSAASATELVRMPVPSEEVQPTAFDRGAWSREVSGESAAGRNFAVLLSTAEGDQPIVVRRRGAWTGEQRKIYDGSTLISAVANDGYFVSARVLSDGRPESVTYRRHPMVEVAPVPIDAPQETILGLKCRWVDLMPHVHDAGRHDCRTEDDIPLKIRFFTRGSYREATAVRLDRSEGSVDELMPPTALLDLATWGVP